MGLDAYVPCRCWQDGKASPPPVELASLTVDEAGHVVPTVPYAASPGLHKQVHEWRQTACPHEDMDEATARIANWAGLRQFKTALTEAGEFPTLHAILPDGNYGMADPAESAAALAELARFTGLASVGVNAHFADLDTGREIWTSTGDFSWASPYVFGYDFDGFYVVDRGRGELFRAMRFHQRPMPDDTGDPAGWVEFADADSDTRILVRTKPIRWQDEKPARMGVVARTETPADYAYIVEPLTLVFNASVSTGNSVAWI